MFHCYIDPIASRARRGLFGLTCTLLLAACGGGGQDGGSSASSANSAAGPSAMAHTAPTNEWLQIAITGYGKVTLGTGNFLCQGPATCVTYVPANQVVEMIATGENGATLSAWGGNCVGKSTTCSLNMAWPKSVTVAFAGGSADSAPVVSGFTDVGGPYPWPTWTKYVPTVPPSTTGKTYYVDGKAGSDSNGGTSLTSAFKTIKKAVASVSGSGGDTVLIKGGLYHEGIVLSNGLNGSASKPTTFGAYGDAEVILDASQQVTWTLLTGTVYTAVYNPNAPSTSGTAGAPIAVVINDVPLKQVTQGQRGSTAPQVGIAGVTSGSGKWGWNASTQQIYADFGTATPASADVVIPNSDGGQYHVYFYNSSFLVFNGLTIRGSGSNGVWGNGHDITVVNCNIKFNGKAAVSYQGSTGYNSNNSVLTTHAYQNVLLNWPRGNNSFAENGGGWTGGVSWGGNYKPVARGNIIHNNGGEGILSYGSSTGQLSGSALFEQNVAYDNWSVNVYFDNQPNDVVRNNILYNHPIDTSNYIYYSATQSPWSNLGKYTVCVMLADEQGSSDGGNNYANLANTEVYDNIFANCRIGVRDYAEGSIAIANHALKNTIITNNTIVMYAQDIPNTSVIGIYLLDNQGRNSNSFIENNIVYSFVADAPVIWSQQQSGPLAGITLNYNTYFGPTTTMFNYGNSTVKTVNLAAWKSVFAGSDVNSVFANPLLTGVSGTTNSFFVAAPTPYAPANADPGTGSPSIGTGVSKSPTYTDNFATTTRTGNWNMGAY